MGEELNVSGPSELEIEKALLESVISCSPWSLKLWTFSPADLTLAVMVWMVPMCVVMCVQ